jgi:uncharacterized protein
VPRQGFDPDEPAGPDEPTGDPDVVNNVGASRYEVRSHGELAGFLRYRVVRDRRHGERVLFIHTEIDPRFEGEGLGAKLVKAALGDARRRHEALTPICPFVVEYIRRHPEYLDLVDERRRGTVEPSEP